MGQAGGFELVGGLIPYLVLAIPLAIGAYHVARAMDRNVTLWTILALVPIVNLFFLYYFMFAVIIFMVNKLKAIEGVLAARST